MNDDFVEASKNRAKLQQQMQQLSKQEQQLQSDIGKLKTETPKLEGKAKNLKNSMDKNPAKTLDERQTFHKYRVEKEGLDRQIDSNKKELTQREADLKKLQTQDKSKLLGESVKQQGMEKSYDGHAVTPTASPLRKGSVQNQFNAPQETSKMPKDQMGKITDHKEFKDLTNPQKEGETKTPNSQLAQSTKDQADKAVANDSKEQEKTNTKEQDDNVR